MDGGGGRGKCHTPCKKKGENVPGGGGNVPGNMFTGNVQIPVRGIQTELVAICDVVCTKTQLMKTTILTCTERTRLSIMLLGSNGAAYGICSHKVGDTNMCFQLEFVSRFVTRIPSYVIRSSGQLQRQCVDRFLSQFMSQENARRSTTFKEYVTTSSAVADRPLEATCH